LNYEYLKVSLAFFYLGVADNISATSPVII
jgi:hypothetical protein